MDDVVKNQYRLQIRVIEARSLGGDKVSSYCRVELDGKKRRTNTRRFCNDPVWDQTLSFRLSKTMMELNSLLLKLSVYNYRRMRMDKLMGTFNFDLQMVYSQPDHCLRGQWLALSPEDSNDITGYLKIFVTLTGPGENAPLYQVTDGESEDDVWGITSARGNFISLQLILHQLLVIWPRYAVEVNMGGKSFWVAEDTIVAPISAEFHIRWPPLCRGVTVRIWTKLNGQITATGTIPFSDCSRPNWSGSEGGFLPAFGPAYLNLYDGPKFCGRILMTITSFEGEEIPSESRATSLVRPPPPQQYVLRTEFVETSMLPDKFEDQFLWFHVSQGEDSQIDCRTDPTLSQKSDHHYFLPWGTNRPQIEDSNNLGSAVFQERSEASNLFRRIAGNGQQRLSQLMSNLRLMPHDEKCSKLVALIDELLTPVFKELWKERLNGESMPKTSNRTSLLDAELEEMRDSAVEEWEVELAEQRERSSHDCAAETIAIVQSTIQRLLKAAEDPQMDMPDILVKMFAGRHNRTGSAKLVAFAKIPAHEILFSKDPNRQGLYCDRLRPIEMKWMNPRQHGVNELPCFVQLKMRLSSKDSDTPQTIAQEIHQYQLRAYLLQGRDFYPANRNGKSNPFVQLSYFNLSQQSQVVLGTVNPEWMETLMFCIPNQQKGKIQPQLRLLGSPKDLEENPPHVALEVFDYDSNGNKDFIGRTLACPQVRLDESNKDTPTAQADPVWLPLNFGEEHRGEVLAAFELYQSDNENLLPHLPMIKNRQDLADGKNSRLPVKPIFKVPRPIRPTTALFYLEALVWGVRDLQSPRLPLQVQMRCGNRGLSTVEITSMQKPNFTDPILGFFVELPENPIFMPPIEFLLLTTDRVGSEMVPTATALVVNPYAYVQLQPKSFSHRRRLRDNGRLVPFVDESGEEVNKEPMVQPDLDWWSKFYASNDEVDKSPGFQVAGYKPMRIYRKSLEEMWPYSGFNDFCDKFVFRKFVKGKKIEFDEELEKAGELRARLHLYRCPSSQKPQLNHSFANLPPPTESCLVRVYVIRGMSLSTGNKSGTANSYLRVKCGKQIRSGKANLIPGTLDPLYGQMIEFPLVNIPMEKTLKIQVWDANLICSDELIGETTIDLENRLLTKFRATIGLPVQLCTRGPFMWRDQQDPKTILDDYCRRFSLPDPVWYDSGNRVQWGPFEFQLDQFESFAEVKNNSFSSSPQQRLSLHLLRQLCLVPEHVETRPICSPDYPEVECGKLQLFVDIFPLRIGAPSPPIDISPRKGVAYQLRVTVFDTTDVVRETKSCGVDVADIFVKCFIPGLLEVEEAKQTETHHGSRDGVGTFNEQFAFNFEYLSSEQKIVVKKRRRFVGSQTLEEKFPPTLMVELWDDRKFGSDRRLGVFDFNLIEFDQPIPSTHFSKTKVESAVKSFICCPCGCCAEEKDRRKIFYEETEGKETIFRGETLKGYWPALRLDEESDRREVAGYVQLQLELLPKTEADANPPKPLPRPKRPWLDGFLGSRLKGFWRNLWRNTRFWLLGVVVCVLLVVLIILFK